MSKVNIWTFLNEIMPLNALFAFIGSLIAIYYTRKNMKATKYIDTITSERIKWLELVRQELSTLCSELIILFTTAKKGVDLLTQQEDLIRISPTKYLDSDDSVGTLYNENDKKIEDIKRSIRNKDKHVQLIKQIYILILRLNPNEDIEVIENLRKLKVTIQEERFVIDNINECLIITEKTIEKAQNMLKAEWEKVKQETLKGSKL